VISQFIQYLRIVGMLCGLGALSLPAQAVYPSKQPIVQVFTAQTAIKFIVQRGSASTELRTSRARTDAISSTFEGSQVSVGAGNNLRVTGSNIVSDTQTTLTAANNITIQAAQNTSTSSNFTERRSSGLSLEGPGVFIGSRQNSNDRQTQGTSVTASTVGSINGNVSIRAGGAYTQVGSDIIAPAGQGAPGTPRATNADGTPAASGTNGTNGNISITARSVSITEARETAAEQTEIKSRQSGLTLSVGSPLTSAAQSIIGTAEAASNTSSGRMQVLAAANVASSAASGYSAFNAVTTTSGNNPAASLIPPATPTPPEAATCKAQATSALPQPVAT
jgi:filamentous hemagglutinin